MSFLEAFENLIADQGHFEMIFDNYGIDVNIFLEKPVPTGSNFVKRTSTLEYYDFEAEPDDIARLIIPSLFTFKSMGNFSELPLDPQEVDAFDYCSDTTLLQKNAVIQISFDKLDRVRHQYYKIVDVPNIEGIYNRMVTKLTLEPYKYKGV